MANPNLEIKGEADYSKRQVANPYRIERDQLIPDNDGEYFRNWRPEIQSPDDIWNEIVKVTKLPGVTSAPKLQPIETRLVMLQTGMRAPMGIKVKGQDLREIEAFGLQLEGILKTAEGVKEQAVFADRIVGKPYLLIDIDRERLQPLRRHPPRLLFGLHDRHGDHLHDAEGIPRSDDTPDPP